MLVDFFICGFQSHSSRLVVIFDLILAMLALSSAIHYDFADSRVLIIIVFVRALLTLQTEIFSSKKLATAYKTDNTKTTLIITDVHVYSKLIKT